ncbi:pseudouridine-5'-phosphatase-like isoform X4 [Coccinella septempunctata]|uniref:pseudouridine-5'-phosphatase-like isoform X4 n=1 Tax=Coccinella septempunctata TaxID=41139 RepID=UPI001D05F755|nr:pseudouridine-5'-phosphatase-like isoform X4 [Coccinella septempunctata]
MPSLEKSFKCIKNVIFDMDGLLLDTETYYKQAISDIARSFGKVYTSEVMNKIVGTPQTETCKIAIREMNLPLDLEQFRALFIKLSYSRMHNVPLLPGAKKLVEHLHKKNIPIAVATSSGQQSFDLKTQNHKEFFKLFNHIVLGSSDPEVKKGKPAPDIFLVCASRFPNKPKPEDCLVFEDSPNGVQGAKAAGMQVVMVPDPNLDKEQTKDATLVLKSLEEFKPEAFGLASF